MSEDKVKIMLLDKQDLYEVGDVIKAFIDIDNKNGDFHKVVVKFLCYSRIRRLGDKQLDYAAKRKDKFHFSDQYVMNDISKEDISFLVKFELIYGLPSSIDTPSGFTRYQIEVIVFGANLILPKKACVQVVNVRAHMNLNRFLYATKKMSFKVEKTLKCCCKKQGKIIAVVESPLSGYTTEHTINLTVTIFNYSKIRINQIFIQLVRRVYYSMVDDKRFRIDEKIIVQQNLGEVPVGRVKKYETDLQFKDLEPTSNRRKPVVDISYFVRIIIVPRRNKRIIGVYQVIIGTVEVKEFVTDPSSTLFAKGIENKKK